MRYRDPHIFLRHLTGDDPTRAAACLARFEAVESGREAVWTSDLVSAEIVYVLVAPRARNG